jgi:hypothetical protein
MKQGIRGALIASAVAMMFAANACHAGDKATGSAASGDSGGATKVKCVGGNDCKGKGACSGAGHDCQGNNSCKGKGWIQTSSAEECTARGGKPEPMKGSAM